MDRKTPACSSESARRGCQSRVGIAESFRAMRQGARDGNLRFSGGEPSGKHLRKRARSARAGSWHTGPRTEALGIIYCQHYYVTWDDHYTGSFVICSRVSIVRAGIAIDTSERRRSRGEYATHTAFARTASHPPRIPAALCATAGKRSRRVADGAEKIRRRTSVCPSTTVMTLALVQQGAR